MRCLVASLIVVSALLVGLVRGQAPRNIAGRQYIFCPCSPTQRGYRKAAADELFDAMHELNDLKAELSREGADPSVQTARLVIASQETWQDCVNNYSLEECVNADTALRDQRGAKGCYPNCASFCEYDRGSWRNNANGRFGALCTSDRKWASKEPEITQGRFPAEVKRTAVNPNPGPESAPRAVTNTRPKSSPRPGAASGASSASPNAPVSGVNTGAGSPSNIPGGDSSVPPEVDLFAPEPPPARANFHEGCVAIEHLPKQAMLQHRNHLHRSVLCNTAGFCATPNHALIIAGKWTSMKRLCENNPCVRTVKLVNNLNALANPRVSVGDIVITPFDIRYPRWCVYVIHAVQLFGLSRFCLSVAALAALALLRKLERRIDIEAKIA